jgi:hypothetical protein
MVLSLLMIILASLRCFLQDKSETQEVIKKLLRMVQNKFDTKVNKIRSDNGTVFKNTQVEDFLNEEDIKHEFSAPYTPQQNGVVERKNRTLIEMSRTMLDEYKTSNRFWTEAINTACHTTNRIYLHKLLKKTSYELLTDNKHNVSYFQVFRSKCYILQKRSKSSKFAPKTYEGVLLGCDLNSHAYRVFNVTTSCIETACDAMFDETNNSQKKQVDLDLIDDEKAPCDALQRMVIDNVRPQDPSNQPQETSLNDTTPLAQGLDQDNHEEDVEPNDQGQEESNDQGEIRMLGIKEKHHHIQECVKMFKEITPSTTYLVISKRR